MNRAFVGENDGWKRCRRKMEDCLMANEKGECILDRCRMYPDDPPFAEQDAAAARQAEQNK